MEDVKAVADTTYSKFFQVCCGRCCCYYADGDRADRGGVGGRNDDNVGVVHGDGDDGDNDDDDDEDNVHDGVDEAPRLAALSAPGCVLFSFFGGSSFAGVCFFGETTHG